VGVGVIVGPGVLVAWEDDGARVGAPVGVAGRLDGWPALGEQAVKARLKASPRLVSGSSFFLMMTPLQTYCKEKRAWSQPYLDRWYAPC
jgi:hypothetical protein